MRDARNECDLVISTLLLLLALIISRSSLVVKNVIGIFWIIDLRFGKAIVGTRVPRF